MLLEFMRVVEEAGSSFAFPTRTDPSRARRDVAESRRSGPGVTAGAEHQVIHDSWGAAHLVVTAILGGCAAVDFPQRRQPHALRATLILLASLVFTPAIGRAAPQPPQHPSSDQDTREASGHLIVIAKDAQGGRLPGATVVFSSPGADTAGNPRVLVTDASGEATLDVPPGDYRLVGRAARLRDRHGRSDRCDPAKRPRPWRRCRSAAMPSRSPSAPQPETFVPPTADGQVETLSPQEIEQLPDDPDELALAIEALAGVGAEIRVNGFEGGALPPKNQIQVVRIRKDPFSTDSMGAGQVRVEIITRPAAAAGRTRSRPAIRDQSIDARPPFSPIQPEGQHTAPELELQRSDREGAVVDRRSAVGTRLLRRQPDHRDGRADRRSRALVNAERQRFEGEVRVEHALTPTQTLRGEYQRWDSSGRQPRRRRVRAARACLQRRHRRRHRAPLGDRHHRPALPQRAAARVRRHPELRGLAQRRRRPERAQRVPVRRRAAGRRAARPGDRDRADRRPDQQQEVTRCRFGFETELGWTRTDRIDNYVGTFTFASLDDYDAGTPQQFTRRIGDPLVTYDRQEFSWFAYDEVEMREGLRFGFGVPARHPVAARRRQQHRAAGEPVVDAEGAAEDDGDGRRRAVQRVVPAVGVRADAAARWHASARRDHPRSRLPQSARRPGRRRRCRRRASSASRPRTST